MSRSVSIPRKWYDSGHVFLFSWRWSDEDRAELFAEKMDDEQERLRAADMMARRFVDEFWPQIEVAILPSVKGFVSWDVMRPRYKCREEWESLLQEFWRKRV